MANDMTEAQAAAFTDAGGALLWGRSLAGEGPAVQFPRTPLNAFDGWRTGVTVRANRRIELRFTGDLLGSGLDVGGYDVLTERFDRDQWRRRTELPSSE